MFKVNVTHACWLVWVKAIKKLLTVRFFKYGGCLFLCLLVGFVLLLSPAGLTFADETTEQQADPNVEFALSPVYLDLYADFGVVLQPSLTYGGENGAPCTGEDSSKNGVDGCTFMIINKSQKDITANISVEPYSIVDENYQISSNEATSYAELAKWIKFDKTKYAVKGGERLSVSFSINVPEDIPGGGQYAIIYIYAEEEDASGGLGVSGRLGLPIFARIDGETRVEAAVEKTDINGFLLIPPITTTSIVNNTGNVDVISEYRIEVKSLFGKTVYEHQRNGHIMPGTPRKVELAWDDTPSIGIFKVKQEVTLLINESGENETTTIEKTVVIIPIWFIILTPLFIAGFIIVVVAKRMMRKQ
jgi:hypothetical protein